MQYFSHTKEAIADDIDTDSVRVFNFSLLAMIVWSTCIN